MLPNSMLKNQMIIIISVIESIPNISNKYIRVLVNSFTAVVLFTCLYLTRIPYKYK